MHVGQRWRIRNAENLASVLGSLNDVPTKGGRDWYYAFDLTEQRSNIAFGTPIASEKASGPCGTRVATAPEPVQNTRATTNTGAFSMPDHPQINREALALILLDRIAPNERDATKLLNAMREILATIDGQRPARRDEPNGKSGLKVGDRESVAMGLSTTDR